MGASDSPVEVRYCGRTVDEPAIVILPGRPSRGGWVAHFVGMPGVGGPEGMRCYMGTAAEVAREAQSAMEGHGRPERPPTPSAYRDDLSGESRSSLRARVDTLEAELSAAGERAREAEAQRDHVERFLWSLNSIPLLATRVKVGGDVEERPIVVATSEIIGGLDSRLTHLEHRLFKLEEQVVHGARKPENGADDAAHLARWP